MTNISSDNVLDGTDLRPSHGSHAVSAGNLPNAEAIKPFPLTAEQAATYEEILSEMKQAQQLNMRKNAAIEAGIQAAKSQDSRPNLVYVAGLIRTNEQGHDEIAFVPGGEKNGDTSGAGTIRWVNTGSGAVSEWQRSVGQYAGILDKGVKVVQSGEHQGKFMFSGTTEGDAVNTVSASIVLETLLASDGANSKSERQLIFGNISESIKNITDVHAGQLSSSEKAELTRLLKEQKRIADADSAILTAAQLRLTGPSAILQHLSETSKTWGPVAKLGGIGLDLLSKAFDIYHTVTASIALKDAKTATDRSTAITQLVTASAGLGIGVAATITSMIATTAAAGAVLGVLGSAAAGVGVGINIAVSAFNDQAKRIDQELAWLNEIGEGVLNLGLKIESGVLYAHERAVVSEIDLVNKTMRYGDVKIHDSYDPGQGRSPKYSGKWLNFYEAYGADKEISIDTDKLKTSSIFLPFGVSKEISYQPRSAPGMAKANGPAADRLVEYFNGKDGKGNFVRNKYAMFGSWHVADFEERRKHTPFTLKLDNVARAIYIPSVKNDDYRRHLSYTIVGGGNTYALVTSAWNTSLTIAPSMADKEAWIIDVTASASERSEADGNGAWKHNVLKDVDISDKRMIVGGQEITFSGRPPKNLSLQLDIHGTSGLSLLLKYDWEKQSFSANLIATNNNLSISEISKLNESIARSGLKFPDIVPVSAHLLGVDYFGAVNLNDKTSLLAGVNKETNKIQFFKDGGELQILNYGGKIDSVGADSIALKDDKNNLSTFKVTKSGAHMLPLVMENAEYSHQEGDSISIFFKSGFNNEVRVPDAVISLMGKRRKLIVTNFSMSEVNPYLNTLNASSWLFPQWIEEVHIFTTGPLNLLLAGDVHSYKAISAGDDLLLVASDGLRIRIDQGYSQERIDHTNLKIRIGGKDIFAKDLADMLDRGSLSADKSIDISSKRVMEGYGELLSKASEKSGKRIYYSREKGAVAVLRHDGNELLSRSVPENLEELAWGEAIPGVKGSDIEYYYNKEKNHIVYVKNGEAPYVWQLPNYFAWNELGKLENLRIEGHSIRFNFAKGNKARNILVPWFYTEGDILTMRDSQGANFKSEIKAKAFTDDVDPMLTLERFALMHYRESVGAAHTLSTPSVSDEHSTQDLVLAGSDARKLAIGHARTAQADVEATLFVQTLNAYLDDETSVMAATESSITFSPPILASALH